jgi:ABC-type proline/glycine betaine transport system substrate-binding protein
MKKLIILLLLIGFSIESNAQIPAISVITTLLKKVLNALDLEVESLQNQTIWLQDAQKTLENAMAQLQLDGITSWVQQTKDLYSEYYQELSQVKQVIADYDKVKQIITLQTNIISEYNSAYSKFKQDKNFSSSEITYMYNVYSGILNESLKNVDQVLLVINAFVTQMSDAGRMNIINNAAGNMQKNYNDLKQFNNQNIQLSLQRAAENNDLQTVKNLYGLQ